MPLSASYVVLVAKQLEIQELKRLKTHAHLVGVIGQMIHVLQSERGASSIFLASSGKRFRETRSALISESAAVENELRQIIEDELSYSSYSNAKIISLFAWVVVGLDALPELRERVNGLQLSGSESVAAFSRIIAGLISLIFELADASVDPDITRLLVALFNLVEGKEQAGQERAVGALAFGSGHCDPPLQQRMAHLLDAQERNFRIFLDFVEKPVTTKWHGIENMPCFAQLSRLRSMLSSAKPTTTLDSNLSDTWFTCCSDRITAMWSIQCELVDTLQKRCHALISDAERDLFDSEGLLRALRERPPTRASLTDLFFDTQYPPEQSASVKSIDDEAPHRSHSLIELLQTQSIRLTNMENELASAKRSLNERKIIERAKGILMARFNLAEDEAYKRMRATSMDQNRRMVEVAESVLDLAALT